MCLDCCLYLESPHTTWLLISLLWLCQEDSHPRYSPQNSLQVPSCCFICLTNIYIALCEQALGTLINIKPLDFREDPLRWSWVIIPTLQETGRERLRDLPKVKGLENAFQSWRHDSGVRDLSPHSALWPNHTLRPLFIPVRAPIFGSLSDLRGNAKWGAQGVSTRCFRTWSPDFSTPLPGIWSHRAEPDWSPLGRGKDRRAGAGVVWSKITVQ